MIIENPIPPTDIDDPQQTTSNFIRELREALSKPQATPRVITREQVDDLEPPLTTEIRQYVIPNEHYLHNLAPLLRDVNGTIIAAGSDQGMRLLAMCPNADRLEIVDIDPTVTLMAHVYLESVYRLREVLERTPSIEEILELYSNEEAFILLLSREPTNSNQHRFSDTELRSVQTMMFNPTELQQYLAQQFSENDYFWMHSAYLDRILDMYRDGHINIHRGNITGGEAMSSIAASGNQVGLVYFSNIINRGYLTLDDVDALSATIQNLPGARDARYIQAVAEVQTHKTRTYGDEIVKDTTVSSSPHDWDYLVQDFESFSIYAHRDNPPIAAGTVHIRITSIPQGYEIKHVGPGVFLEFAA